MVRLTYFRLSANQCPRRGDPATGALASEAVQRTPTRWQVFPSQNILAEREETVVTGTVLPMSDRDRAAIYVRISKDSEQNGLGVERQRQDCLARCEREGWTVIHTYVENNVSASKPGQPRPEYAQMIADAQAGKIDRIVAYSNSRITRRPWELQELIELHRSHGITCHTIVSGDDDLSTADGRLMARIKADIDLAEAEKISERVKRQQSQSRADGTYRTRRPFGWNLDGTLHPVEGPAVKQAISAVLQSQSLASITRGWNEQGIKTAAVTHRKETDADGNTVVIDEQVTAFTTLKLRKLLIRWRNAGIQEHKGQPVEGVQASWEPLCSRSELEQVRSLLLDPSRRTSPGQTPTALMSSILRCGVCGRTMIRTGGKGGPIYRCVGTNKGANPGPECWNSINVSVPDTWAIAHILPFLTSGQLGKFVPSEDERAHIVDLRSERAALADKRKAIGTMIGNDELDLDAGQAALAKLKDRHDKLTAEIDAIHARFPMSGLIESGTVDWTAEVGSQSEKIDRIFDSFLDLDVSQQRAIINAFITVTIASGAHARGHKRVSVTPKVDDLPDIYPVALSDHDKVVRRMTILSM